MPKLNMRVARKGFTLVELLVVVLILAILMAVALPLYLSSVKDSSKKTCRANLQSIANAEQAWKVQHPSSTAYTTDLNSLSGDLGATPQCPDSGTYSIVDASAAATTATDGAGTSVTVPKGSYYVHCTKHNDFVPGVTSN
jgi:type IV pilus assembly protein PilA